MKIAKTNSESEADNYNIIYYFYVEAVQQLIFSVFLFFMFVCLFVLNLKYQILYVLIAISHLKLTLVESMMGLRSRQGNLRLVFRSFSLMRGLSSLRLK